MNNKHVYVIEGNSNTGKTLTAWLIYLHLKNEKSFVPSFFVLDNDPKGEQKYLNEEVAYYTLAATDYPYDFHAALTSGTNTIAVYSAGDSKECVAAAFQWMKTTHANVLVCTSRSNGNSYARKELEKHVSDYDFTYFRIFRDSAGLSLDDVVNAREPLALSIANQIVSDLCPKITEEKQTTPYIQSFCIKGLWNEYDLRWDFNKDVNILTGHCGSGKSTVLCFLYSLLRHGRLQKGLFEKVKQIEITFSDGTVLTNHSFSDSLNTLENLSHSNANWEHLYQDVLKQVAEDRRWVNQNDIQIVSSMTNVEKNGERIPVDEFLSKLHVDIIRTFDIPSALVNRFKDEDKDGSPRVTELDKLLRLVNEKFAYYIGKLASNIEQYSEQQAVPQDFIYSTYAAKNAYMAMLNRYLGETGKRVIPDQGRLRFQIIHNNKIISLQDLSSGEKQLVYILTKVLVEEQQPYLLLMDEPELSLHISWQKDLIQNIRILNPNCQIVLITHSPSMLSEGYYSYVTYIDDIRIDKE